MSITKCFRIGKKHDDLNKPCLLKIVWMGVDIYGIILSTLVIVAMAIELDNVQFFFIANLMICDIISSLTVNFMVTGITVNSLIDSKSKEANCKMEVHPGKDGHVRSVRLQVGEKQYSRPLVKVCSLELEYA